MNWKVGKTDRDLSWPTHATLLRGSLPEFDLVNYPFQVGKKKRNLAHSELEPSNFAKSPKFQKLPYLFGKLFILLN
jgi:hypothetical protein